MLFLPFDPFTSYIQGAETARKANWDDLQKGEQLRQQFVQTNIAEATQNPNIGATIAEYDLRRGKALRGNELGVAEQPGALASATTQSEAQQALREALVNSGVIPAEAQATAAQRGVSADQQRGFFGAQAPGAYDIGMQAGVTAAQQPVLQALTEATKGVVGIGTSRDTALAQVGLPAINDVLSSGDPIQATTALRQGGLISPTDNIEYRNIGGQNVPVLSTIGADGTRVEYDARGVFSQMAQQAAVRQQAAQAAALAARGQVAPTANPFLQGAMGVVPVTRVLPSDTAPGAAMGQAPTPSAAVAGATGAAPDPITALTMGPAEQQARNLPAFEQAVNQRAQAEIARRPEWARTPETIQRVTQTAAQDIAAQRQKVTDALKLQTVAQGVAPGEVASAPTDVLFAAINAIGGTNEALRLRPDIYNEIIRRNMQLTMGMGM